MTNDQPANTNREPAPLAEAGYVQQPVSSAPGTAPATQQPQYYTEASQPPAIAPQGAVVQLREEQLVPTKQWVESGAVLVRKEIESRTQTVPVQVLHEEVEVQRVPVNRPLAPGAQTAPWQDGDVLVIPIVEEEIIVTKRLVVREEMRIRKVPVVGEQQVSDTVRRENIRLDTEGNPRLRNMGQEPRI